jgi:hypothetical protein
MKATIYRIVWGEKFYIGSSIQPLNLRLNSHRYRPKGMLKTITDWSNVKIEPIEEIEYTEELDRFKKETEYIVTHKNNENCMNIRRPFTTKADKSLKNKEYKENNPERYAQYETKSYETRKVKKVVCECGKEISAFNIARHRKLH